MTRRDSAKHSDLWNHPKRAVASACGLAAFAAALAAGTMSTYSTDRQPTAAPLAGPELASMLVRVGLNPEALCAAGVTPSGVTGVAVNAEAYLADRIESVRAQVQARDHASREVDRLERAARAGGGPEVVASLGTARQTLEAAEARWSATSSALLAAATGDLTEAQVTAVRTIHANRDRSGVAVEYLLITRTDAEWVTLRDALAHVRVAEQTGSPINPELHVLITNANAVPATAIARQNLQLNRQLCMDTFMAATLGQ